MDFSSFLTTTNTLVGLIIVVVSAGAGVIGWLYRRVGKIAREANPVDLDTSRRVQALALKVDEIEQEQGTICGRVGEIEKRLETVATQKDIRLFGERLAGLEARVQQANGMLHTLYEAAIQQSKDPRS